jgi:hypothetical protein
MKAKSNILVLILMYICTLLSCIIPDDPEPPTLPPLTTEGKNTFGCLINGRVFVPDKEQLGKLRLSIFFEQNSLQLQAKGGKESVLVDCDNVTTEGTYFIPPPPFDGGMYKSASASSDCWHQVLQNQSKITINYYDKTARIISGTFEYLNMKPKFTFCNTTKVINITEGRFDVKF